ncbi:hypothetical protein [Microbacterium sp. 22242]|uniref:hypothetical protein n=1 Tax=Microbacterium sp. 22242 TaxID=3453896 RepID=UPI003F8393B0
MPPCEGADADDIDDRLSERWTLNRALFARITLEDDTAPITPTQAIATILVGDRSLHDERNLPRVDAGQGSNFDQMVDLRVSGFTT